MRLDSQRFVWAGIRKDCGEWSRQCLQCQKSKITRHTISPLPTFLTPFARFSHINHDIVGPLIPSYDYSYCLNVIDRNTRWPVAYPLKDITAETCAAALVSSWIARFGCPAPVTTDRGRQFESNLFSSLTKLIGANHFRTTAFFLYSGKCISRLSSVDPPG